MTVKRFTSSLVGACLSLASLLSAAQGYPSKPVRIIVPFAVGGVLDTSSRIVAISLAQEIGQPVIVENKAGGGGNIGTEFVAHAEPDGYTILMLSDSNTIAPALYKKLGYNPVTDFVPISLLASGSHVLVAHPSLQFKDISELIQYAKTHPDELSYASPGTGTAQHLAGEMFKSAAGGLQIAHVPYKGGGQAINDVVGGQVKLAVLGLAPALPQIQAGKLKALAVTGATRVAVLPDVPTVQESGFVGFETTQWFGAAVPAGTPLQIVTKLHKAFVKAVNAQSSKVVLDRIGMNITTSISPTQFAEFIKRDVQRWPTIVKSAGATVD